MSYLRILYEYINSDLRDRLNFREKYSYPFLNDDKNIIFFKKDSSPNFDLKDILVRNKDLITNLKQTFKNFLLQEIEARNIDEVKLIIDDKAEKRGFGIIIIQESVEIMDIYPYVEIMSHFDTAEQINDYCRSNKIMRNICGKKELWISLIKKIYPFKYKYEYNYEKLYKEYLKYKTYKIDEKTGLPLKKRVPAMDNYPYTYVNLDSISEIVNFLMSEAILLPKYYKYYFAKLFERNMDQNYLQLLINKIRNILNDQEYQELIEHYLNNSLLVEIDENENMDYDLIKIFMRLDFGPQYDMYWKMKYFLTHFAKMRSRPEKIRDAVDVIIDELPLELKKEFISDFDDIYS